MAGTCSQQNCFPDDTGCNIEGYSNASDCKNYSITRTDDGTTGRELGSFEEGSYVVPWTGNAFGLIDLNYLTASSKPVVIGIAGAASAGKTTFLALLYCLLRNGSTIGSRRFAGSLTLTGWEDIAWYLSWKNHGDIQFPLHTANDAGRVPGLLHLALRSEEGEKTDVIFTDAPGEWFEHWRTNTNSENAKGAKWIHDTSDGFLLFADCDLLASSARGQAKLQINSVADRILENLSDRPFGLVWSKSDIPVSALTKQQIVQHIECGLINRLEQFSTSVKEGDAGNFHKSVCDSVHWILEMVESRRNVISPIPSLAPHDVFLSKRAVNG